MAARDTNENEVNEGGRAHVREERPAERRPVEPRTSVPAIQEINRILGGGMPRRTNGNVLTSAVKAVKAHLNPEREIARGNVDLNKLQVIGLEASELGLGISSVILAVPKEEGGVLRIFTSVLALEATMLDESGVRNLDINGRTWTVPVLGSDYVTDSYLAHVERVVSKQFESARNRVEVVCAGWRVVDRAVDFSDEESSEVRSVVFYAQAALSAMMAAQSSDQPFFCLDWLQKNSSLEISVDMSGKENYTSDGLPRRNDISIAVSGTARGADGQTQTIPIATLGGYINLMYCMPKEEQFDSRRRTPPFVPVFVINRLDSATNAVTPEQLLLALGSAAVISSNPGWARNFLPGDVGRGAIDYKDTGLLNILSNPEGTGEPVVFEGSGNIDESKWFSYFSSLVDVDNLAWAIELEEGGENSWITSLLLEAASDTSENGAAVARLANYADRLTTGHYSRRAREMGVTYPLNLADARYLTGTYLDENRQPRDLRDWDTLRWLAAFPDDRGEAALRYQSVIDRTDIDTEIRVAEQYRQLTEVMPSGVKFSRYVDLVYIDPHWIAALARAIGDCNINIDSRSATYSFGARRLRGNTRIRDYASGDLAGGALSRRSYDDGTRSIRTRVGNGFGGSNY